MPLVCDEIRGEALVALNRRIAALPLSHPLRKECADGNVEVANQCGVMYFHSAAGFYFEHMQTEDLETEIARHIKTPRNYHCSAFEVDADDPTVVRKLLDRFQEQHGAKYARTIDHAVIHFKGKQLMLVKFPGPVLRQILSPGGGLMKTGYSGPIDSIKQIPTIMKLGGLKDTFATDGFVRNMVVTEYASGQLPLINRIHWDIVREVIARPNLGITLNPVGAWDP